MIFELKSAEIAIDTANTVSDSSYVRVINNTASAAMATIANTSANTGSLTLSGGESIVLKKDPTDTVQGTGCEAVAVSIFG
mgnify:CR=1 FL=1